MVAVLEDLDDRLSYVKNPEEVESLLRETEEIMVRETQDWLSIMRFLSLEVAS